MKFLKWGAIGLGAVIVIALAVGFFLPSKVHVERSVVIARPQATVYTVAADWRQFNEWSPWAEMDPDAAYTYEGEPGEIGSKMIWKGNEDAGAGSQELIEAEPYEKTVTRLIFGENGEQGEATATMTMLDVDGGTEVTWAFDYQTGALPWERYSGLFIKSYVGPDYEKGLAKLKTYVEGLPEADFSHLDVETVDVEPVKIAYVTMRTAPQPDAIGTGYQKGYEAVWKYMQDNDLASAGMPMGINTSNTENEYVFDAALPVTEAPAESAAADGEDEAAAEDSAEVKTEKPAVKEAEGEAEEAAEGDRAAAAGPVKLGTTYGGKALRIVHTGPYSTLEQTYEKARAYMIVHRMEQGGRSWEHFVTDPGEVAEADLVTHIYIPLK